MEAPDKNRAGELLFPRIIIKWMWMWICGCGCGAGGAEFDARSMGSVFVNCN